MTHIFGGMWVYLAHESQIPNNDDFITVRLGLRPAHPAARLARQDPRLVQPLHPSRHHAVPQGEGLCEVPSSARITAGVSSIPASCAAYRGRTAMLATSRTRNSIVAQVPRVDSYRGFIFGTLNPDAPPLLRIPRPHHGADRRMARPPSRRQGHGVRGEPAQVQGQLEARLRQFRRRLSRGVLAPLAAGDGESAKPTTPTRACRIYKGSPDDAPMYVASIWATAITSRTSGRT